MSEELASEGALPEVEAAPVENADAVEAEGVTESEQGKSEDGSDRLQFGEREQRFVNDIQAAKRKEIRKLEQKLEAEKQEREKLAAQLPQETRPNVPEIKDKFDYDSDEEYFRAISDRDKAIADGAKFDAKQEVLQQQAQYQQQQALQSEQERLNKLSSDFMGNAKKAGIDEQELNGAIQSLNGVGISPDLGAHIMSLPDGGNVAVYLSKNFQDTEQLLTAGPYQAGVILEGIRAKAAALKPNVTEAPDPIGSVGGSAVPPVERGPKGASFE